MTYAMIDAYCASYPRPPVAVTLDIDDTVDVVHGHQQLSSSLHPRSVGITDAACQRPGHLLTRRTPENSPVPSPPHHPLGL